MSNNNFNILLTRPKQKSQQLAKTISVLANTIEITPLFSYQPGNQHLELKQQLTNDKADIIIFVSQAAVEFALQKVSVHQFNQFSKIIAVGSATQRLLLNAGIKHVEVPKQQNSEGLLELDSLHNIKNYNIVIIRGNGGRELLKQQLELRGANVAYNEVYKRVWLASDSKQVVDKWRKAQINCIVVTSTELLLKTLEFAKQLPILKKCLFIVASERIEALARHQGITNVINAYGADNDHIFAALKLAKPPLDVNYD